jgi:hypothetical protein
MTTLPPSPRSKIASRAAYTRVLPFTSAGEVARAGTAWESPLTGAFEPTVIPNYGYPELTLEGLHETGVSCRPNHSRQLPKVIPSLLHVLCGLGLLVILSRIICNRRRRYPRLGDSRGLGSIS